MNILVTRGGGIRGASTAAYLAGLEDALGRPAASIFNLVAGTSTGAIVAVGLALGLAASDIVEFYRRDAAPIFKRRFLHRFGLLDAKYSSRTLIDTLNSAFGYRWLASAKMRTMITTTRLDDLSARFFKSWKHDITAGLAAACSAAAPTYFDPIQVVHRHDSSNRDQDHYVDAARPLYETSDADSIEHYADGGLFANDPAIAALSEARELQKHELLERPYPSPIRMLDVACPTKNEPALLGKGAVGFAPRVVDAFMATGADYVETVVERDLGRRYFAAKPGLESRCPVCDKKQIGGDCRLFSSADSLDGSLGDVRASAALDDASPDNVEALIEIGRRQFAKDRKRVEDLLR